MKKTLTRETALNIRKMLLDYAMIKDIQSTLDIPEGTWQHWYWNNTEIEGITQGFRDFVNKAKHERIINKAEHNLEALMSSEDERVVADMTKFSLETLGKEHGYSKKVLNDITSKGESLSAVIKIVKPDGDNIQTES